MNLVYSSFHYDGFVPIFNLLSRFQTAMVLPKYFPITQHLRAKNHGRISKIFQAAHHQLQRFLESNAHLYNPAHSTNAVIRSHPDRGFRQQSVLQQLLSQIWNPLRHGFLSHSSDLR